MLGAKRDREIRVRMNLLRVLSIGLLAVALVIDPKLLGTFWGRVMWDIGIVLIFFGILGRLWSILYIGGKKSAEVISDGPYSLCRHPLYLFSTIASFGFALMLQSLIFALFLTILVFLVLFATAANEEAKLRELLGPAYGDYARKTPRILPRFSLFRSEAEVTFRVKTLRVNFADALVFLGLIPVAEAINWWHASGIFSPFTIL